MASTTLYRRMDVVNSINTLKNKGYKISGSSLLHHVLSLEGFEWLFPKYSRLTVNVIAPRCRKPKEMTFGEIIAIAREIGNKPEPKAEPKPDPKPEPKPVSEAQAEPVA